ncbi:MAG: EscU/YscU/HrcU family type III secretion system export apparatus switch protein [Gammaproteobacteria bacterium]
MSETRHPIAIALEYDGEAAPRVTAKGEGDIARQIIELAEEHGVPLQENPELVRLLKRIPLGDEIPEALYYAVAEVIAFAYIIAGRFPEGFSATENR